MVVCVDSLRVLPVVYHNITQHNWLVFFLLFFLYLFVLFCCTYQNEEKRNHNKQHDRIALFRMDSK
jgi:hypothetical protein